MKRIHQVLGSSLLGLSLGVASQAHAGIAHSVADAAPVIGVGDYSGRLVADVALNNGGGLDITPRVKTGILDQYVDITGVLGAGSQSKWQLGAVAKYNLLPDVAGQVGFSFLGGFHLLHNVDTDFVIGLGTLVSKKLQANFGDVTPYSSLELEFLINSGNSSVPVHLNFGAIWEPTSTGPWSFITEAQLGLARGRYALALGTAYRF